MKKLILTIYTLIISVGVFSQEILKVAMLEPIAKGGNVTVMQKEIIRGALEEAITNIPGYEAFTRTDIDQITSELSFQQSGMVDDDQRKRVGIMSGAELICLSQVTVDDGYFYVKSSLIEVESGRITRTANELMKSTPQTEILAGCQKLAKKLMEGVAVQDETTHNLATFGKKSNNTILSFTANGATFEMIFVQGGTFTMGCTAEQDSDCYDNEKPAHQVILSDFYIGKFEVTQLLWRAVMGKNHSSWTGDNLPVENVSWNDCQDFIRQLNRITGHHFRLPTEAEWEYAARGGNKNTHVKYAGGHNLHDVGWFVDNSNSRTQAVGCKLPNELGIYDMSGNVYEWCFDWYSRNYYAGSPVLNPQGPGSDTNRVLRGGSWRSNAKSCRVSNRSYETPDSRVSNYGFRLALVP